MIVEDISQWLKYVVGNGYNRGMLVVLTHYSGIDRLVLPYVVCYWTGKRGVRRDMLQGIKVY